MGPGKNDSRLPPYPINEVNMSINRILVADDEESMRWVLSKALRK